MKSLRISISGVRGIVGESLTPELAMDFALAFGTYCKGGKVVLGYDTRISGPMLKQAMVSGLMAAGCEIIDVGVVPTPTVQIMVRELGAAGGVIITASHNPIMWNGFKFVREDGIFLNADQAQELIDIVDKKGKRFIECEADREDCITDSGVAYKGYDNLGSIESNDSAAKVHMDKVLANVNVDLIKSKKYKIVLDTINGAGCEVIPAILEKLGVEVKLLNGEPTGKFAHNPEPVQANLTEMSEALKSGEYDAGFAIDADADRLAILDETGRAIGEDYTLTLVTDYLLSREGEGGLVVTNLSTTQAIDDIAAKYKAEVIRTKIGEVNVSEILKGKKGTVGGEGNGGVMVPAIGFGRDTLAGVAFVLELMATKDKKVSEIVADMPQYVMVKDKVGYSSNEQLESALDAMREKYSDAEIDEQDGVKVIFKDSWVHVRSSNTEPIIRIIAEHADKQIALKMVDEIKAFF